MFARLGYFLALLGLLLLAAAGLFLAVAHDPNNLLLNYQAEVLADSAYGLLLKSVGCFIIAQLIPRTADPRL